MSKETPPKKKPSDEIQLITRNRRALFDYAVERRLEAGMELLGTEVKSLRDGQVNLSDAYAMPEKGQLFLHNCNIAPYKNSGEALNHAPTRRRRLLLNRRELDVLSAEVKEKGYSLIPLSLYWKDGFAKAELGVCRGKTHGDRRDTIVEREHQRDIDRAVRGARKGRPVRDD
jgi:SsrA-binding protein